MIVAQYEKYSAVPEEVISAKEIQEPLLAYDEVLIKVLASPINPADLLMLKGQYGSLPLLPAVGGSEGVGKVINKVKILYILQSVKPCCFQPGWALGPRTSLAKPMS